MHGKFSTHAGHIYIYIYIYIPKYYVKQICATQELQIRYLVTRWGYIPLIYCTYSTYLLNKYFTIIIIIKLFVGLEMYTRYQALSADRQVSFILILVPKVGNLLHIIKN